MSSEEDKAKHSARLHRSGAIAYGRLKSAKLFGLGANRVSDRNKFDKTNPFTCGNSNCVMCGNPRKFFGEKTIQERRLEQDVDACYGKCHGCATCGGEANV